MEVGAGVPRANARAVGGEGGGAEPGRIYGTRHEVDQPKDEDKVASGDVDGWSI